MKKIIIVFAGVLAGVCGWAQNNDALKAVADAAMEITAAQEEAPKAVKPNYWTESLKTNIKFGQTSLTNWAAGGDNTVSLAAFIDGNANWKKDEMFWNNRLQLDYGFLYASSKPIVQKSTDRMYLESKWGYKAPSTKYLYFSANFDFKSQFSTGYDYNTPSSLVDPNTGLVSAAILGIGINCLQSKGDFPPELRDMATSLAMHTKRCDPAALAAALIRRLQQMDGQLREKKQIMASYKARCVTLGKEVSWLAGDTLHHGTALDLDENGGLVLHLSDGTTKIAAFGEVSIRGMYGYL